MNQSVVQISLRGENGLDCSFAIVQKQDDRVIILVRAAECAVFDADELQRDENAHYLLLKHYPSEAAAYLDFMKLIGKMCTKKPASKYFAAHIEEDNRMIVVDAESEHMITTAELADYASRLMSFKAFIADHSANFFKTE